MPNQHRDKAQASVCSPSPEHIRSVTTAARDFIEAARQWLGPECPDVPRFAAEIPVYEEAMALARAIGKTDDRCFDPYTAKATGWPHDVSAALMRLCFSFDSLMASWHWPVWQADEQIASEYNTCAERLSRHFELWMCERELFQRTARKFLDILRENDQSLAAWKQDRAGETHRRLRELEGSIDGFKQEPFAKGAPARIDNERFEQIDRAARVLEAALRPEPIASTERIRATRPSDNEERDKFIYEQVCNGVKYATIREEIGRRGWETIDHDSGITQVINRYCDRTGLPRPVRRRS